MHDPGHTDVDHHTKDSNIWALSSVLVWLVLSASLATAHQWYPYYGAWLLTLLAEVVLISLNSSLPHSDILSKAQLFVQGLRILILISLLASYFGLERHQQNTLDEERAPLLADGQERTKNSTQTRSKGLSTDTDETVVASMEDTRAEDAKEEEEARQQLETSLKEKGNWISYLRGFTVSFINSAAIVQH